MIRIFRRSLSISNAVYIPRMRVSSKTLISKPFRPLAINSDPILSNHHKISDRQTKSHEKTEEVAVDERGALQIKSVVELLVNELNAVDVCLIDMREKCQWTDWMVICSGVSRPHVRQLSSAFYQMAKKSIRVQVKSKSESVSPGAPSDTGDVEGMGSEPFPADMVVLEGAKDPEWKCVDLGNVIVHFFTPEARKIYDLESLWTKPS